MTKKKSWVCPRCKKHCKYKPEVKGVWTYTNLDECPTCGLERPGNNNQEKES